METTFLEAFKHNPIFFLLALVAAVVGVLFALTGLILSRKYPKAAIILGLVAALAGMAAVGFGVIGWLSARSMVDLATGSPGLSASDRARLQAYGYAEAAYSVIFGAVAGILPVVIGLTAMGVGVARRKRAQ